MKGGIYMKKIQLSDESKSVLHILTREEEVIGYCEIDKATADKANRASNAYFYFGFDKVTSPEKY